MYENPIRCTKYSIKCYLKTLLSVTQALLSVLTTLLSNVWVVVDGGSQSWSVGGVGKLQAEGGGGILGNLLEEWGLDETPNWAQGSKVVA